MLQKIILLTILTIIVIQGIELKTLAKFINHAYDQDGDGQFSLLDWKKYYQFIQPDIQYDCPKLKQSFDFYDSNLDGIITFKEILQKIEVEQKIGPKQIHLGLTGKNNEMQVIWITQPQKSILPVVQYGVKINNLNHLVRANWTEYNVGHFGFHGRIYKAVMIDLVPRQRYFYRVGDQNTGLYSQIRQIISPPNNQYYVQKINIGVFGDMGTIMPFGFLVSNIIQTQNQIEPFDFVFHCGDIAYASTSGSANATETQPIWDLFGQITEKWASFVPYMPGVGNHQAFHNFTAYNNRYYLPRSQGSGGNYWFSFDYAQLHMIHISTQHPFDKGTPQYIFLQNDLKKARNNPNTKWIILGGHRPFYSVDNIFYNETNKIVLAFEDLLKEYKVDIIQTGHVHSYQRSWPLYKGKAFKNNQNINHFVNPQAPIYVVQGTAGALINHNFYSPLPEWHIKHESKYGFGKIKIINDTLTYQFITTIGKVMDQWSITKN